MPYRNSNSIEKITIAYAEVNPEKRREFIKVISSIPKDTLVYVDASEMDAYPYCPYARAQRDTKAYGPASGRRLARGSFIAAKCGTEILVSL